MSNDIQLLSLTLTTTIDTLRMSSRPTAQTVTNAGTLIVDRARTLVAKSEVDRKEWKEFIADVHVSLQISHRKESVK